MAIKTKYNLMKNMYIYRNMIELLNKLTIALIYIYA